jgi:nitrogen fixation NifU-like protein
VTSDEFAQLYQELILDHSRTPEGKGIVHEGTARSHQINPTCGDEVTVVITADADGIAALEWDGHGCAISQASTSMMTGLVTGCTRAEALELTDEFRTALRSRGSILLDPERFGDAAALSSVSRYVARVKCAMLPWVALEKALEH